MAPAAGHLMIARVGLATGCQAEIVPSSVAKMKIAGSPGATRNSFEPLNTLNTIPVGAEVPLGPGGGTVTKGGAGNGGVAPLLSYKIDKPFPFEFTHQGPVGL